MVASPNPPLAGPASIRFTLCRGGPVYRLMCWMRFITPDSARIGRRVLLLIGVTWLPMLVLAAIGGLAFGDAVRLPFLRDITVYARFLVALPVFLVASKLVDERLELAVNGLASPDILPAAERPRFDAALRDLEHRRDWFVPEVLLLAIAVAGGFLTQQATLLFGTASWQALPVDGVARSTPAGRWLTLVATPILWFLIGRWLWRMLSWSLFLRRVSKLDLTLVPTHPDHAAGLGFLGEMHRGFAGVAAGLAVVVSARAAVTILYGGWDLGTVRGILIAFLVLVLLLVFGPLLVFTPKLIAVRRRGMIEYSGLAAQYVRAFDRKWLRGEAEAGESVLGSADVQSLADMGGGFDLVRAMRPIPVTLQDLIVVLVATLLPMLPAAATVVPIEVLLKQLLSLFGPG